MKKLKINISFDFQAGAWGGGNQFLKALRTELVKIGFYESNPIKSDCILFNSHHNIKEILRLKHNFPNKIFIHRIDGPVYLLRGKDLHIDKEIYEINNTIADGIIFQSKWSRDKNYQLGLKRNRFETVIVNAPDPHIFFPSNKPVNTSKKKKLVAVSWSSNINKGFDLYKYLDENLDFNVYSMTFIGNSPFKFNNIEHLKPLNPKDLANVLREFDIYITGSKNDPCSNSLIEALSCGLPALALHDGGHPEIIKRAGETFKNLNESIMKIDLISRNYEQYQNKIIISNIEEVSKSYLNFCEKILNLRCLNKYEAKKLRLFDYYKLILKIQKSKKHYIRVLVEEIKKILSYGENLHHRF